MDWLREGVFRKVHGFFGLARFENTFIAVPPPAQYLKHEEQTKKIYQTDKFIVVEIDVEVGEALGTRLTAGANWSRARSDSPDLQPHLTTTRRATQAEARDRRRFQRRSEEPEDDLAAKRRRLEAPQFLVQSNEHDDEPEMSGSSPGKRPREHQLKASIQVTEAKEAYSSGGGDKKVKEEIADSADEEASDLEEVLSAKRVPRNLVKYGWVSSDDINVADVLGRDPHAISNELAIANEARTKSWAFIVDRYHRSTLPESDPAKHVPDWNAINIAVESSKTMKRRNIVRGPQPTNRLGSKPPFPESPHKPKVFDLTTGGRSENGEQRPSKRRRMEPSSEPFKAGSELIPPSREELGAEKTGSLRGHAMHKSASTLGENTGVEEYKGVEIRVQTKRPRNRNSESFENETINGYGSGQVKRGSVQQSTKQIRRHLSTEDPQDPIVDDSDDPLKQKLMAASKKKAMAESGSRDSRNYKGTSGASGSKGHGSKESPYFPPSRQNSSSSAPRSNGANSSRASDNPNRVAGASHVKKIRIDVDNESTDDLSIDHYKKAQSLLRPGDSKRIAKPSSKATSGTPIDLENSSSDEEPERGDIQPTTFTTSQKSNPVPFHEFDFHVRQAVSDAFKWKPSDKKIWIIRHNTVLKTLRLIDDNHKEMPTFSLSTGTILHIDVAEKGSIIGLSKSRDINPSTKVYLQLADINEAEKLIDSLRTHNSTIQIGYKQGAHLQKCLINFLEKEFGPPKSQRNKLSLAEEKELGQLMKTRKNPEKTKVVGQTTRLSPAEDLELRLLNERTRRKTRGQSDDVQHHDGNQQIDQDSNRPIKSQGMSKAMKLKSSPIEEGAKNGRWVSEVAPKSFYGGNDRGRASSEPSHETSTPTRRQRRIREPSPSPERWSEQNPDWASNWKASLIYPKEPGKRNKTTVDERDIERLDEGQFLNDNIINFYLSWLEEHHPELKGRVFFHHSFFYQQLTTSETGKGGFHYSRVERWTSKVDLLKYDYIIVPVNEHYHWYLAIICNAPNLMRGKRSGNIDQSDGVVDLEKTETGETVSGFPSTEGGNQKRPESTPTDIDTKLEKISLEYKSSKSNSPSLGDGLEHDLPPSSNDAVLPQDNRDLNGFNDLEIDQGPTQIGSDLLPASAKKSAAAKKTGNRTTGTSIYDPAKPRIITLDSLGSSHSPTCTNLKKYLIQEIESKKHQKVDAPQAIGMSAKNIPTQDNSCDCGLYLLGYTEMFLEDPDDFVRRLVQRDPSLETEKITASKMRADIRDILFKLQSDQVAEAEKMKREKSKSKRVAVLEKADAATQAAKPSSRVSSKSAPTSPRDNVPELSHISEKSREPVAVVEVEQGPSRNDASTMHKSSNIKDIPNDDGNKTMKSKSLDSPKRHSLPKGAKMSKPKLKPANEVIELDDSPQKSNHEMTTSKKKHMGELSAERPLHSARDISMPKTTSLHEKSRALKIKSPSPEDYPDLDREMYSSPNPDITTPEEEKLTSPNGVEDPAKGVKRKHVYEIEDSQTSDPQLLDNDDSQQAGPALLSSPKSSSTLFGNSRSLPNSPPLNLGRHELLMSSKGSKRKHNGEDVAKSNKRRQSSSPPLVLSPKNNIRRRDASDTAFLKQYHKPN